MAEVKCEHASAEFLAELRFGPASGDMESPIFDVMSVAALMNSPVVGYVATVDRMRVGAASASGVVPVAGEAVRHFAQFADRVRELDEEELKELYAVSFGADDALALRQAAEHLRQGGCAACASALPVLQRLLAPLDRSRNPFAALFKGLCCLMLACRAASPPTLATGFTIHPCPLE